MRIYWIKDLASGCIGMMSRPRGNDWLSDEISYLRGCGVDHVVSLLESHEIDELELELEQEFCSQNEIEFTNFPIADCEVPKSKIEFNELIKKLVLEINNGRKIIVHCRMGIGRTSTVVAAILIQLGEQQSNVFEYISTIRTLEVPDTKKQKDWVLSNCLNSNI